MQNKVKVNVAGLIQMKAEWLLFYLILNWIKLKVWWNLMLAEYWINPEKAKILLKSALRFARITVIIFFMFTCSISNFQAALICAIKLLV